jgi:hypothetical protein
MDIFEELPLVGFLGWVVGAALAVSAGQRF